MIDFCGTPCIHWLTIRLHLFSVTSSQTHTYRLTRKPNAILSTCLPGIIGVGWGSQTDTWSATRQSSASTSTGQFGDIVVPLVRECSKSNVLCSTVKCVWWKLATAVWTVYTVRGLLRRLRGFPSANRCELLEIVTLKSVSFRSQFPSNNIC